MSKQREFPTVFQPWAMVTGAVEPRRPETVFEALMETAPGEEPEESVSELQPLREAIADTIDLLSDEHKFVINAIQSERISYRQLAKRLGCSLGKAHSLHDDALAAARAHMMNNQTIRERLNMAPTWNSAVREALREIEDLDHVMGDDNDEETLVGNIEYWMAMATSVHNGGMHLMNVADCLMAIGTNAIEYLKRARKWDLEDEARLLCSKQNDYGHYNILAFGMTGVLVRMNDKVARLLNLLATGRNPKNESVDDTFADLVGYAAIACMLNNDTFELELDTAA